MRRHKGKIIIWGLVFAVAIAGFVPWSKKIALSNGGCVRIAPASFFNNFRLEGNASATITYYPQHGKPGKFVLWADLFDGPVMVMPAAESNVLLCLYDFDVKLCLFRIDTAKEYTPLSATLLPKQFFNSSWEADYATPAEWQELLKYVKNTSQDTLARQSVHVGVTKNDTADYILACAQIQGITISPK